MLSSEQHGKEKENTYHNQLTYMLSAFGPPFFGHVATGCHSITFPDHLHVQTMMHPVRQKNDPGNSRRDITTYNNRI